MDAYQGTAETDGVQLSAQSTCTQAVLIQRSAKRGTLCPSLMSFGLDGMNFILGLKRRRIEDRIMALAHKVEVSQKGAAWLDREHLWDFIYAWHDLLKYYEDTDDTVVGAQLIKQALVFGGILRDVIENETISLRRRERAQMGLMELHMQVDAVLHQVERNVVEKGHTP